MEGATMESHWIERESSRAEILARGNSGRVRADIADALDLAGRCRLLGWTIVARGLITAARHIRTRFALDLTR